MFAALKASVWAYPALEIVHIAGIAMLLGNLMLLELRVFGLGSGLAVKDLSRLSLGLALAGFGIAAASGLMMFASQPEELLGNRAFSLKMLLLVVAGCNAAWFHGRASLDKLDGIARVQMLASTMIWLAILACGRWIAYL